MEQGTHSYAISPIDTKHIKKGKRYLIIKRFNISLFRIVNEAGVNIDVQRKVSGHIEGRNWKLLKYNICPN